jgi:large subunit ribosomal protein L15
MQAHQLKPPPGAKHAKKRIGRGNAAGQGTYSGRGLKGQKARAGNKPRRFFEGGQTRLFKKLPFRRGFRNPFRIEYQPVNLDDLQRLDEGTEVTPELLKEKGILRSNRTPIKILASGELTKKLNVTAHRFSLVAKEKIEAAGGSVVELTERKQKKRDRAAAPAMTLDEAEAAAEAADEKTEAPAQVADENAEAAEEKAEAAEAPEDAPSGDGADEANDGSGG